MASVRMGGSQQISNGTGRDTYIVKSDIVRFGREYLSQPKPGCVNHGLPGAGLFKTWDLRAPTVRPTAREQHRRYASPSPRRHASPSTRRGGPGWPTSLTAMTGGSGRREETGGVESPRVSLSPRIDHRRGFGLEALAFGTHDRESLGLSPKSTMVPSMSPRDTVADWKRSLSPLSPRAGRIFTPNAKPLSPRARRSA